MISRLFAKQRIDAPAAVNPDIDVAPLERLQHLYDIVRSHVPRVPGADFLKTRRLLGEDRSSDVRAPLGQGTLLAGLVADGVDVVRQGYERMASRTRLWAWSLWTNSARRSCIAREAAFWLWEQLWRTVTHRPSPTDRDCEEH